MKYTVIFDLDGTLTDPYEGITRSIQIAMESFGVKIEDRKSLKSFIGPPLKQSFMEHFNLSDSQGDRALCEYRKYFSVKGLFENTPYDGIYDCLEELKDRATLLLATSKPIIYAQQIIEKFELKGYFEGAFGSNLDGSKVEKAEVIADAIAAFNADKANTFMVGDRSFDIKGAKANGLRSVGVSYGYGSVEELTSAGADYIADSPTELKKLLLTIFDR